MALPIECSDGCGRTYWSIAAMMMCDCDRVDKHGQRKHARGDGWLP